VSRTYGQDPKRLALRRQVQCQAPRCAQPHASAAGDTPDLVTHRVKNNSITDYGYGDKSLQYSATKGSEAFSLTMWMRLTQDQGRRHMDLRCRRQKLPWQLTPSDPADRSIAAERLGGQKRTCAGGTAFEQANERDRALGPDPRSLAIVSFQRFVLRTL